MSSVQKLSHQIRIFMLIVRFLVKKKVAFFTSPVYMLRTVQTEAHDEKTCAQTSLKHFDPTTSKPIVISSQPVNLFSVCYTSPVPHFQQTIHELYNLKTAVRGEKKSSRTLRTGLNKQSEQTLSYLLELCHRNSRLPQMCHGIFTVLLLCYSCVMLFRVLYVVAQACSWREFAVVTD